MSEIKIARLLTRQEVESRLHVSESTVRRIVKDGGLVALKVRGQLRFREADVDSYLDSTAA